MKKAVFCLNFRMLQVNVVFRLHFLDRIVWPRMAFRKMVGCTSFTSLRNQNFPSRYCPRRNRHSRFRWVCSHLCPSYTLRQNLQCQHHCCSMQDRIHCPSSSSHTIPRNSQALRILLVQLELELVLVLARDQLELEPVVGQLELVMVCFHLLLQALGLDCRMVALSHQGEGS